MKIFKFIKKFKNNNYKIFKSNLTKYFQYTWNYLEIEIIKGIKIKI